MIAKGHDVYGCAPDAPAQVRESLAKLGVQYIHVPIDRAGMNPVRDLRSAFLLFRLFKKIQPNIVLSYTAKPVIWGSLAARAAGVPASFAMITGLGHAFIHSSSRWQRIFERIVAGLYRTSLTHTRAVFFQNPDDRNEFHERNLLKHDTRAVLINGSGVDLEQFPQSPLPDTPVFLLMARLLSDKGIREYREAARCIRAKYPMARFLLAGGYDANPTSISQGEIQNWQREGHIEYLGKLEDVRPALAQARIYVLPSYYREGIPRTILEAMSSGRPVITTDAPGCRETVQDGVNGFVVPVKDAAALADAMEKFIVQPGLAESMGRESRRMAEHKYDVHKVNRVILEAMGLESKIGHDD